MNISYSLFSKYNHSLECFGLVVVVFIVSILVGAVRFRREMFTRPFKTLQTTVRQAIFCVVSNVEI